MSRTAAHPIDPMFTRRWSARAMSGKPVSRAAVETLLEAARWAPSSSNMQPWRFAYALGGTPLFEQFFGALVPFNQGWANKAGALLVAMTDTIVPGKTDVNTSAAFDAGSAWMSLALQGSAMGLVVHAMGGFDRAKAREMTGAPKPFELMSMIAVGHPGDAATLPEGLRDREFQSDRNPQSAWAVEGRWPAT
jgi:nitroreductase